MIRIRQCCVLLFALFGSPILWGQSAALHLRVVVQDKPLEGVHLWIPEAGRGLASDGEGRITMEDLPAGNLHLHLSLLGYRPIQRALVLVPGTVEHLTIAMDPEELDLEAVTVTASRGSWSGSNSPVVVSRISSALLRATQSVNLAEGLSFSPGLRLETNCQNCGFTQVRMNGLAGPYSQILINSRPVFSAMAGVYGLELLPVNMIERVEVLRGAGSVLYGGNAIAGTINIITRPPEHDHLEAGIHQAFTGLRQPDQVVDLYAARAREDGSAGVNLFAYHRRRAPWDANGDGYSELTRLDNLSLGAEGFLLLSRQKTLRVNAYHLRESRRGGTGFDLPPHQTPLTEQLGHRVYGLQASLEHQHRDLRRHWTLYGSLQHIDRDSYYGSGGRVLAPGDSLTESDLRALNAYGRSRDQAGILGFQYRWQPNARLNLLGGAETPFNLVQDEMPGYARHIRQTSIATGTFVQAEAGLSPRITLQAGARADLILLRGDYRLGQFEDRQSRRLPVVVPRVAMLYAFSPRWKARVSLAQGYRAPQAFDEDLHVETAGGLVRFIRLDPRLQAERSGSMTASLTHQRWSGAWRLLAVLEGFHTRLDRAFVLSDPETLPGGISVITKRNGSGALVEGLNAEFNLAWRNWLNLQSGFTLQRARYREDEVLWESEHEGDGRTSVSTRNILRTPEAYGYYSLEWQPDGRWTLSLSGVFTGRMDVPHLLDPEDGYTVIRRSPVFYEQHLRLARTLTDGKGNAWTLYTGVQNLFDSYQRDLDRGAERDAGYVYGPSRPRTLFAGVRVRIGEVRSH